MIIKMFNQGKGRGGPIINYLFNEEKHKGYKPELISGNQTLTKSIIDSTTRVNKYTTGVISFKENEMISEEHQLAIIHKFERTFAPFEDESRINFLWVRHYDKGRLELHFLTPMTELKSGLQYNISPPGKPNQNFYKAFQDILNYKCGFNSVSNPDRKLKENEYRQLVKDAESYYNKRKEYILKRYDAPKKIKIKIKGKKYERKSRISKSDIQYKYKHFSFKQHSNKFKFKNSFGRANKLSNDGIAKSRTKTDNQFNQQNRIIEQQNNAIGKLFENNIRGGRGGYNNGGDELQQNVKMEESSKSKHDIKAEMSFMNIDQKLIYLVQKLSSCSTDEIGKIYEELGRLQAQKLKLSIPKMKF